MVQKTLMEEKKSNFKFSHANMGNLLHQKSQDFLVMTQLIIITEDLDDQASKWSNR